MDSRLIETIRNIRMSGEPLLMSSESSIENSYGISVADVYDQASGIGKELEKLIDCYGSEAITGLLHKVVRSLELLEALAIRYEQENTEIGDLKYTISRLEAEKVEKAQERARYEKELELIEDNWQEEVKDLLKTIDHLQVENKQYHNLRETLKEQQKLAVAEALAASKRKEEEELQVLARLKETIDKQRDEIRSMKKEINLKQGDTDALQSQLERVGKINSELRRKNSSQRKQTQTLLEERLELQSHIQDKEKQIHTIKGLLKEQECESSESLGHGSDDSTLSAEELSKLEEKLSKYGKITIDISDQESPRFSIGELREVLKERNELKARLIEVEEELRKYKSVSDDKLQNSEGNQSLAEELTDATETSSDEEGPVQGPINREPFEKLYPYSKDSQIRKFFRFILGKPREPSSMNMSRFTGKNNL
ncbi:RILP-like protein 1 isoform X3 [Argonauta hians]